MLQQVHPLHSFIPSFIVRASFRAESLPSVFSSPVPPLFLYLNAHVQRLALFSGKEENMFFSFACSPAIVSFLLLACSLFLH